MGERIRALLRAWYPTILAVIILVIDIAINFFSDVVLYWLVIAFLILQIINDKRELSEVKNKKPNIVVDSFKLERPFYLFRNGRPSEIVERYYVMFRNFKPPGKEISDTKPIHAIVSFFNTDCEILDSLSHEEPFWLNSEPPWGRPDNFEVTLKASSKPEGLCLVIRQQGGSDLYVFCDKSYVPNIRSLDPFQGSLRIPLLKFFVRVELRSENLEMKPIWISVTNRSEIEEPLFEVIEAPIET